VRPVRMAVVIGHDPTFDLGNCRRSVRTPTALIFRCCRSLVKGAQRRNPALGLTLIDFKS